MAGKAEGFLRKIIVASLAGYDGWWLKKNTDMNAYGLKEAGVDYNLALVNLQVEVKNSNREGVLDDMPTPAQVKLLDQHGGFILLVMWEAGYPRLPQGGDAYLVPWPVYQDFLRATDVKGKSIRRHTTARAFGADQYLRPYQLTWQAGGWHIPLAHPFWDEMIARAARLAQFIECLQQRRAEGVAHVIGNRGDSDQFNAGRDDSSPSADGDV